MKVITISGEAEHGKDSLANALKILAEEDGRRVAIVHYADYLKYIAEKYFGWDGQKDEAGRSLLQHIGTDLVRNYDPNFWVESVLRVLQVLRNFDLIIIPDARFPNEIMVPRLKGYDLTAMHVARPGHNNRLTPEQRAHPSETALRGFKFDEYVVAADLDELDWSAEHLYAHLTWV